MPISDDDLHRFLERPVEGSDIELKGWLKPTTPHGRGKIARALIALRNSGGGWLIIGFKDDGLPDDSPPEDVPAVFHPDVIQKIVSDTASEQFAVEVKHIKRAGQPYPVIRVPGGARTPVYAVSDIVSDVTEKNLIQDNQTYVRSLHSSGTYSSSPPIRADWDRLVEVCFQNREADIARFISSHLTGQNVDEFIRTVLARIIPQLLEVKQNPPCPNPSERADKLLDEGHARFLSALKGRALHNIGTREAAAVIDGEVPEHTATPAFLHNLQSRKPVHSGWRPWIDSRNASDDADRPYPLEGGWEALLYGLNDKASWGELLDFWRIDPKGQFYLLAGLEDDLKGPGSRPKPNTELDFLLQISGVAEIISVVLSFAKTMGCSVEDTSIEFAFRWTGLEGRHLSSWADPGRMFYSNGASKANVIKTEVRVPLQVAQTAIAPFVERAVRPLFEAFQADLDSQVIAGIANDTVTGNM